MKRKNELPTYLKPLIRTLQSKGKKVKYKRYDNNAGEHGALRRYCEEIGIASKMTAPNTP